MTLKSMSTTRLKREVEIGIRVRSRNVVSIYGVEKYKIFGHQTLAIMMELIEGDSLKKRLEDTKIYSEGTLLSIARQVANGLKSIHSLGIIHRDIKPANLIVTKARRGVLTDLGIARLPDISARVTATGSFIGTCTYASPEQFASAEDLDPRSDLYSLGVVLYELSTGTNPFRSSNIVSTVQAHLRKIVDPPHMINPDISEPCSKIIMRLIEKKRDTRFASASTLIKAIDDISRSDVKTTIIPLPNI